MTVWSRWPIFAHVRHSGLNSWNPKAAIEYERQEHLANAVAEPPAPTRAINRARELSNIARGWIRLGLALEGQEWR